MRLYKYGMKQRGFSIGAQPAGVKYYQDTTKEESGYWSFIYYDRELTQEELRKYDLEFVAQVYMCKMED